MTRSGHKIIEQDASKNDQTTAAEKFWHGYQIKAEYLRLTLRFAMKILHNLVVIRWLAKKA